MSKTAALGQRGSRLNRREERMKRQNILSYTLIGAGALLVVVLAAYLIMQPGSSAKDFDVTTALVNYDQPLHAIHEMDMPGDPKKPIPFLPKDGPQPAILIPTMTFNFGNIGATDIVAHDFVIANTGQAPLTISRAYTSCGCTTADFTSDVIPPGETAIVTLRLDAGFHDVRGQTVRRDIIIENNDPANSEMVISVQASVGSS